ncbi:hypothetical protein PR048_010438 [Dryococelus australis]|uniref:Ig-like domain-containing protein n=1 Tax=Dryococelus australis TaxID=614101 RepID=A0ABQ9I2Q4_9NEOP|nr:hypothetical protein PR048_010438 [Dryococelus australis]
MSYFWPKGFSIAIHGYATWAEGKGEPEREPSATDDLIADADTHQLVHVGERVLKESSKSEGRRCEAMCCDHLGHQKRATQTEMCVLRGQSVTSEVVGSPPASTSPRPRTALAGWLSPERGPVFGDFATSCPSSGPLSGHLPLSRLPFLSRRQTHITRLLFIRHVVRNERVYAVKLPPQLLAEHSSQNIQTTQTSSRYEKSSVCCKTVPTLSLTGSTGVQHQLIQWALTDKDWDTLSQGEGEFSLGRTYNNPLRLSVNHAGEQFNVGTRRLVVPSQRDRSTPSLVYSCKALGWETGERMTDGRMTDGRDGPLNGVGQCWVHEQKTDKRYTSSLVYAHTQGNTCGPAEELPNIHCLSRTEAELFRRSLQTDGTFKTRRAPVPTFRHNYVVLGGAGVRLLASHLGESDSIPNGDTADRWVFMGVSRFLHPFISALLHTHFTLTRA